MALEGKYLYCIIKEKQPKKLGIKGIEGREVYVIPEGELSAVVSDSSVTEYFVTKENVTAHQKVIEEAMKKYTVLPISFGNVAKDKNDLKERLLKAKKSELQRLLKEFEGKIELGIKAFWVDMSKVFNEIANSDEVIKNLQKQSKGIIGRLKALNVGKRVSQLLESEREEIGSKIKAPLLKLSRDFKENKILMDSMILNSAFLIEKSREKEFDKKVNEIASKLGDNVKINYVGPLPPYNFIEMPISLK